VPFAGDNQIRNLDEEKGVDIPMQPITPYLWFDKEAKEAAEFHTPIFKDSRVEHHFFNELCEIVKPLSAAKKPFIVSGKTHSEPPANYCKFESSQGTPNDLLSG
jgi:3-demethylubiquinone-9 3-methyltransferase